MRRLAAFAVVLGAGLLLNAQNPVPSQPAQKGPDIVMVSSADAAGSVSMDRVNSCLHQLVREWKQDEKELPNIVVFHVSRKAGRAAGVLDRFAVRLNRSPEHGDLYYEVWFVDEPSVNEYVVAIENVIESHFHLSPTETQRQQAMKRTAMVQSATISAYEGK